MNQHLKRLVRGMGILLAQIGTLALLIGSVIGGLWLCVMYPLYTLIPLGVVALLIVAYIEGNDEPHDSSSKYYVPLPGEPNVSWEEE